MLSDNNGVDPLVAAAVAATLRQPKWRDFQCSRPRPLSNPLPFYKQTPKTFVMDQTICAEDIRVPHSFAIDRVCVRTPSPSIVRNRPRLRFLADARASPLVPCPIAGSQNRPAKRIGSKRQSPPLFAARQESVIWHYPPNCPPRPFHPIQATSSFFISPQPRPESVSSSIFLSIAIQSKILDSFIPFDRRPCSPSQHRLGNRVASSRVYP